jgi:cytoskeletal protein CcmA (bactofilin family)
VSTATATTGHDHEQLANRIKDGSLGFVGDVQKFSGEIHFKSMLRVDGKFTGQISSPDGTLIISSGAQISGAVINVAVAKINGSVEGDVNATKELVLGRTAIVVGTLTAAELVIEQGAVFNGSCRRLASDGKK